MKYNTIVIDPAWNISMKGETKSRPDQKKKLPYKTMSLEQIKSFPLDKFANKGCHVYCWTTNKMLKDTFDVLEAWGVNFHLVLVANKTSAIAPCYAYRFGTEFLLLGFYGKPMQKFIGKGKLNWIKYFPKKHSEKPIEMYNLIKEMSPEPRIDIFSRRCIAGYDAWGDEAPNEKQIELNSSRNTSYKKEEEK